MIYWFKFPLNYWDDTRMFKLRKTLKSKALWVPAKLWSFAALQDTGGDLSGYDPGDLAAGIGFRRKDGPTLLRALIDAGYLDSGHRVVGWSDLFGLAESRRRAAEKGAKGRWGKSDADLPERERTVVEEKEDSRVEAHALRDGMRDASNVIEWPSDLEMAEIRREHALTATQYHALISYFREKGAADFGKGKSANEFKLWLRSDRGAEHIWRTSQPRRSG